MVSPVTSKKPASGDASHFFAGLRRYVAVGLIATGVDWVVFSCLVFVFDWHYLPAGIVSFLIATFAGYLSGLRWVFRSGRFQRWVEVAFVYLVSFLGFAMHTGTLVVLVSWMHTHMFVAKVVATAITFLWNYAARYFLIFDRETANV
jgi:putative flippase GtrA